MAPAAALEAAATGAISGAGRGRPFRPPNNGAGASSEGPVHAAVQAAAARPAPSGPAAKPVQGGAAFKRHQGLPEAASSAEGGRKQGARSDCRACQPRWRDVRAAGFCTPGERALSHKAGRSDSPWGAVREVECSN